MNWLECEEIEVVPGRCGGRPTVKGIRIEPGSSVEEIHENFPSVPVSTIKNLIEFAHKHQLVP